jgi:hypothetical protein
MLRLARRTGGLAMMMLVGIAKLAISLVDDVLVVVGTTWRDANAMTWWRSLKPRKR